MRAVVLSIMVFSGCSTMSSSSFDQNTHPVSVNDAGPVFDAGQDAGVDGGADAGPDAGPDAGTDAGTDAGATACGFCAHWGAVENNGTLEETALNELSGLVASRAHPGVLWAHNDSGDSARFFALSDTGVKLGRFNVGNATAVDWEDLALGPCPAGTCVFLGDIGDNNAVRSDLAIYRLTEPEVTLATPFATTTVTAEKFPFQYPGGTKRNAETLLVHPVTGDIYVLSKPGLGTPAQVFKFPQPLDSSGTATLIKVADLPVPTSNDSQLTGGDISPCGNAVLLRMYNRLVELRQPDGQPFEKVFTATPVSVPVESEPQGEAVGWAFDGKGYYTSSESNAASGYTVHVAKVRCDP